MACAIKNQEEVEIQGASPRTFSTKLYGGAVGKGGHRRRYRDDGEIKTLHGLYEEPKDDNDGHEDDDYDGDCDDMEEKEREEDDDNEDDVVDITAVQLFGIPNEAFIGNETENKKKKDED